MNIPKKPNKTRGLTKDMGKMWKGSDGETEEEVTVEQNGPMLYDTYRRGLFDCW